MIRRIKTAFEIFRALCFRALYRWLSEKHLELRDASEFGDKESILALTDLIQKVVVQCHSLPSTVNNMVVSWGSWPISVGGWVVAWEKPPTQGQVNVGEGGPWHPDWMLPLKWTVRMIRDMGATSCWTLWNEISLLLRRREESGVCSTTTRLLFICRWAGSKPSPVMTRWSTVKSSCQHKSIGKAQHKNRRVLQLQHPVLLMAVGLPRWSPKDWSDADCAEQCGGRATTRYSSIRRGSHSHGRGPFRHFRVFRCIVGRVDYGHGHVRRGFWGWCGRVSTVTGWRGGGVRCPTSCKSEAGTRQFGRGGSVRSIPATRCSDAVFVEVLGRHVQECVENWVGRDCENGWRSRSGTLMEVVLVASQDALAPTSRWGSDFEGEVAPTFSEFRKGSLDSVDRGGRAVWWESSSVSQKVPSQGSRSRWLGETCCKSGTVVPHGGTIFSPSSIGGSNTCAGEFGHTGPVEVSDAETSRASRTVATRSGQSHPWTTFRSGWPVAVPQFEVCTQRCGGWSVWDDHRTPPRLVQRHAHIARVLPSRRKISTWWDPGDSGQNGEAGQDDCFFQAWRRGARNRHSWRRPEIGGAHHGPAAGEKSWGRHFSTPTRIIHEGRCECIARILQGVTDANESATVISVDGVSAFDLMSRGATMQGLMRVDGGSEAVPFVRIFYGAPSENVWEDSQGVVHTIPQDEGGEKGDPLMKLLFAVVSIRPSKRWKTNFQTETICSRTSMTLTSSPNRRARDILTGVWKPSCGIEPRFEFLGGKTKIWDRAGIRVWEESQSHWSVSDCLERVQALPRARTEDSRHSIRSSWICKAVRGEGDHQTRLVAQQSSNGPWFAECLVHPVALCGCTCQFPPAGCEPDKVEQFAHKHDHQIWECLARILDVDLNQCEAGMKASATLPMSMEGLGLRSAVRTRVPARWRSWADCLPMVHARHPDVAMQMVGQLEGDPETSSLELQRKPPGNWWESVVSNLPHGEASWQPDDPHETWMILNQAVGDEVGSTRRQAARNNNSRTYCLLPGWALAPKLRSGPRQDQEQGWLWWHAPRAASRPFLRSCSVSSLICADCVSLFTWPVWRPTRRICPSPCSVRTGRGVEQAWMGIGERGRVNMPRSWWQGDDERLHARFGFGSTRRCGRSEARSHRGRFPSPQWSPPRRHTGGTCCTTGRCRVAVSSPSEGTHVPRVAGQTSPFEAEGPRRWSRRQVFWRNADVLSLFGQSHTSLQEPFDAQADSESLASSVKCIVVLHYFLRSRLINVGVAWRTRQQWHSSSARCGAGFPLRQVGGMSLTR